MALELKKVKKQFKERELNTAERDDTHCKQLK